MEHRGVDEISFFEIEDKIFENKIYKFCKDIKINCLSSSHFLTKRDEFQELPLKC